MRAASRALALGATVAAALAGPDAWAQAEVAQAGRTLYQAILQWAGIALLVGLVVGLLSNMLNLRVGVAVGGGVFVVAVLIAAGATFLRMTGLPILV